MKTSLTIWLLTCCLIATSGQRQNVAVKRDNLPDSIRHIINKMADRAARDSAYIIDSIVGRIEPLNVHIIPDTPESRGRWRQLIWYYRIRGRDTLFLYPRTKPL